MLQCYEHSPECPNKIIRKLDKHLFIWYSSIQIPLGWNPENEVLHINGLLEKLSSNLSRVMHMYYIHCWSQLKGMVDDKSSSGECFKEMFCSSWRTPKTLTRFDSRVICQEFCEHYAMRKTLHVNLVKFTGMQDHKVMVYLQQFLDGETAGVTLFCLHSTGSFRKC